MKRIVYPNVRGKKDALDSCREFATEFSTDQLDWVRRDLG
jgi:hypothetical protein